MSAAVRVLIDNDPYAELYRTRPASKTGVWPCQWIGCSDAGDPPFVTAYRRGFSLKGAANIRIHVTADERYELFLDGERIGRGPERGDPDHWFFETYDLDLSAGPHILTARVWSLGFDASPFAQMSVEPGFLLAAEGEEAIALLGTGVAEWEARVLEGYEFQPPIAAWGTGHNVVVHGDRFSWGFERGEGAGWAPVQGGREAGTLLRNDLPPTQLLTPAMLPPMLDEPRHPGVVRLVSAIPSLETHAIPLRSADTLPTEAQAWSGLLAAKAPVTIPARTRRRVIIDLEDYYCAYPECVTTGGAGALIRIHWQESLFDEPDAKNKGNRDEFEGKYFVTIWWIKDGIGDSFLPDGGSSRKFDTLWWQCGRFVEVVVETGEEPLTLESFTLRETRYPLEWEAGKEGFRSDDPRLSDIAPIMLRTLQMCAHETYMDCPYYEQLQYVGDTRLQALATYVLTRDDRLPRKALRMFNASRLPSGLTQSRYPSRVRQITPSFALWWVAMVHDFARWRDHPQFIEEQMPGVRGVIDAFRGMMNEDGLVRMPTGPNYPFLDWVPGWPGGAPAAGPPGVNAVVNWQMVLTLRLAAELEAWAGDRELAQRNRRLASEHAQRLVDEFWDESRGLFADDLGKTRFSEHSQCLAVLSGQLDLARQRRVGESLLNSPDLARTTIYFTHYLFEAYRVLGRTDALLERMVSMWFDLKTRGLKTTVEMPEPTRSDCHAWGAHPLYHYFATLLGIRPAAPGFSRVEIAPQLGRLTRASGTLPHPRGNITVEVAVEDGGLRGTVSLPEGITGSLLYGGKQQPLHPGAQEIDLETAPRMINGPQLQMVLPEEKFGAIHSFSAPEGYRLRCLTDADEQSYIELMARVGFGRWDSERFGNARRNILPGGFFVIEYLATGRVVATAMATHRATDLHPEGGELSWVAADPDHRGLGLGRIVSAAATARMVDAGYRRIYLLTDDFRLPAINIYLNLGYRPLYFEESMPARWTDILASLDWQE